MNLPEFRQGTNVANIGPGLRALRAYVLRHTVTFSERFTVTEGVGGTLVDLAGSVKGGSSTIVAFGVASSPISAASSQGQPGTYGTGTVTLDADGGTGYSAGDSVTVKNRWPMLFAADDLLELISNDGGTTWYVANRYCPDPS